MGCEAFPALSSLACVASTFSFTVSHRAVICAPGTIEKLSTSELPRPPVPMTPIRTFSRGVNFRSATLFAADCDRTRPAPSEASPATFNKSRLEKLSIALPLLPEFLDYLNDDEAADREDGAQNQRVGGSAVENIAHRKE